MRKTALMKALEAKHEKPIEMIVAEALSAADGNYRAAATALGVNFTTLYYWVTRLGIKVKTVVEVA